MRFSAAFTLPLPLPVGPRPAVVARVDAPEAQPAPVPPAANTAPDLPEDLDARVRLVGEWQLGEPE